MATNPIIIIILGLALVFIVTYLVGFIIVKAKKIDKSSSFIILGSILLFYGLIGVFLYNDQQQSILCFSAIILIIEGLFTEKGYHNKTYYLFYLGVFVLFGLTFVYLAVFMPNAYGWDNYFTYLSIGAIVLCIVFLIRTYLRRHKNPKILWKNEW